MAFASTLTDLPQIATLLSALVQVIQFRNFALSLDSAQRTATAAIHWTVTVSSRLSLRLGLCCCCSGPGQECGPEERDFRHNPATVAVAQGLIGPIPSAEPKRTIRMCEYHQIDLC